LSSNRISISIDAGKGISAVNDRRSVLLKGAPDSFLSPRLRMRHIRLLVALDEHRNMHRAAAACATTQPAATRLLADLERLVGVRLFERTTRAIVPNEFGVCLVHHARTVLGALGHARDELDAIAAGAAGKVALGALLVAATALVPKAILAFKARLPRITVLVREGTGGVLLPILRRGELDLLVGRTSADFECEDLVFDVFYTEPVVLVVRVGHPLTTRTTLSLADLAGEEWIMPTPEAPYRKRLDAAFRQAGVERPRRIVESMSLLTNKALLQGSDRLAVMPRDVAHEYTSWNILAILPVDLPDPTGPVGVITVKDRPQSRATVAMLAALREAASEITATR
jgi:DNA-binding transcriptional LysR family regulator